TAIDIAVVCKKFERLPRKVGTSQRVGAKLTHLAHADRLQALRRKPLGESRGTMRVLERVAPPAFATARWAQHRESPKQMGACGAHERFSRRGTGCAAC